MLSFWNPYPPIENDLSHVQEIMYSHLQSKDPLLSKAIHRLLSQSGKMLRPAFVLLGARLPPRRNGKYPSTHRPLPEKIYNIAAAVEILHLATLVHDDVIDHSLTRRGTRSVNGEVGDRNAVLTGDFLFSRCFSLVSHNATMQNARYLSRGVSYICESEVSQSRRFDPETLSVRNYMHRIIGKTALLFSLSLFVGAEELKAPSRISTLLRRIGYSVGISFQIIDDVLDFTGSAETVGKPTGGDLREGIYTLPVILASIKNKQDAYPYLSGESLSAPEGYEKALRFIKTNQGIEKALEYAESYTSRAVRDALRLPSSENRDILVEVIQKLLHRQY